MTGHNAWRRLAKRLWRKNDEAWQRYKIVCAISDHYNHKWREALDEIDQVKRGARQTAQIMDAVLCRVCLDYGQEMPNGGRRISMEPVSTSLLEEWAVSAFRGEDGEYQILIKKREPPSD